MLSLQLTLSVSVFFEKIFDKYVMEKVNQQQGVDIFLNI